MKIVWNLFLIYFVFNIVLKNQRNGTSQSSCDKCVNLIIIPVSAGSLPRLTTCKWFSKFKSFWSLNIFCRKFKRAERWGFIKFVFNFAINQIFHTKSPLKFLNSRGTVHILRNAPQWEIGWTKFKKVITKSSRICFFFFIFNSTVHTTAKKKPHQETLVTCQCNVGGNWAIFSTKSNPREVQGQ